MFEAELVAGIRHVRVRGGVKCGLVGARRLAEDRRSSSRIHRRDFWLADGGAVRWAVRWGPGPLTGQMARVIERADVGVKSKGMTWAK